MDIKKEISFRVYISFILLVVMAFAVLGYTGYVQRVEGAQWRKLGDSTHIRKVVIKPERGTIFSEDGNILSTSVPIFDIFLDFGAEGLRAKDGKLFKQNIDSLSIGLAQIFNDKSSTEYKRLLQSVYKEESRYFPLKKKITYQQFTALEQLPLVREGKNKSGFIVKTSDKRINPYVLLANRTIGLSRNDSSQNVGLELSFDTLLRGTNGYTIERYVSGSYIPVTGGEFEPENGKDIVTTLDTYIQDIAESALMEMLVNNNSLHGTAIVMETATGKIKAIANLGKQAGGSYIEDLNYGVGKVTEPGSVFKLATTASLMDDGFVTKNTVVDCEGGAKRFYGLRIADSHLGAGKLTVKEAFLRSSNVAFAKLANQYYHANPKMFLDNLHKYRLDVKTGIEIIANSGTPVIKKATSKSWSATTIPYMAHGYEELVTPLHLLTFYNAIANNGKLMKPYLVSEVKQLGVTVQTFLPTVLNEQVCKPETVKQLQECLLAVVDSARGTGRKVLGNSKYKIAGKTGTAVTALNNQGYNKGNKIYQSSFMGYFPAQAPKYTLAVVIQNTRESKLYFGADVAGAVFKKISDRIYGRFLSDLRYQTSTSLALDSAQTSYFGRTKDIVTLFDYMQLGAPQFLVGSNEAKNIVFKGSKVVATNSSLVAKNAVPNVVGMGLKDALYYLENAGLKVKISGKGKVALQSINAGEKIVNGKTINLLLN